MQFTNYVFVIETNKQPLNPVTPKQARRLMEKGKAAVFRQSPFTLILKQVIEEPVLKPLILKIDPDLKFTTLALLSDSEVIFAMEIEHREQEIKNAITSEKQLRWNRRSHKKRYRQPRFNHRKQKSGLLPPSLMHGIQATEVWIKRLIKYTPIAEIWIETVKFDLAKIQNPEVSGVESEKGELISSQVREYLLEKWKRECSDSANKDVQLQEEDIVPQAKEGSE